MKKTMKKLLSAVLALMLCVSVVPAAGFAAEPELQFARTAYYSKITEAFVEDSSYYSDEWFLADPEESDDRLALLSAQLSMASATADGGIAFLEAIGFDDVEALRYDSADPLDSGYAAGTKTVNGTKVAAVVFQGDLYGDEGWQQNVTVNLDNATERTQDQHSYAAAAEIFLADFDSSALSDADVLWITGGSRAGAIANLAAAYLLERTGSPDILCYTFESPATTENAEAQSGRYDSIHNYICSDDPITMLPIWGMTRYGEEIPYNSVSPADVIEEAAKVNPAAREFCKDYTDDVFDYTVELLHSIVNKLGETVPTREMYSEPLTISVPTDEPFTYTYQGGLQALCHVVFGSEAGLGALTGPLTENLGIILNDLVCARIEEVAAGRPGTDAEEAAKLRADSDQRYLMLAELLCDVLSANEPDLNASAADFFGLIKLLAPHIVLTDGIEEALPAFDEDFDPLLYIDSNVIILIGLIPTIVFSHHPDMIIARLKLLAPAPALDDINMNISTPAAGDDTAKAPEEIAAEIAGLDLPYLSFAEAHWETDEASLGDNRVYYLSLTVETFGHTVPDSFRWTLNGEEPVETEIRYEDGEVLIEGVWQFATGTPDMVEIRFDAQGHGETPEPVSVPAGSQLGRAGLTIPDPAEIPDEDAGIVWQFRSWTDADGTLWEDVTAEDSVTLYANWVKLIDRVEITYPIPHVGDGSEKFLAASVPEGAPYEIISVRLYNENFDEYVSPEDADDDYYRTVIDSEGEFSLTVELKPTSDAAGFHTETYPSDYDDPEWNREEFIGTATVNGEIPVDLFWERYDDEESLVVSYDFHPLPAEPDQEPEPPADDPEPEEPTFPVIPIIPVKPQEPVKPAEPAAEPETPAVPAAAPEQDNKPVFRDVPADAYYAEPVAWAVENGITSGVDEEHFAPDAACTRAQMVTFLWRLAGEPEAVSLDNPFVDVTTDSYAAEAILWAYENGITNGTDADHFSPDAPVSRGQAITLLYRMKGEETDAPNPFSDVSADAYYRDAVLWAVSREITRGKTENLFAPDDLCTRAQIVTFLYRLTING